jgi:hypothetical protein
MLARKTPYCADRTTRGSVCEKVRDVLYEPWPSRDILGPNRRDINGIDYFRQTGLEFQKLLKSVDSIPFPPNLLTP